jgi:signal transduction histidine kinase
MAAARCRYTLRVMGINNVVRLPRRWLGAAGIALVTVLAVVGAYVEANPVHHYGGLHLTSHPPLAAYLLLAVPGLALIWRNSRPVGVLALAVTGAVGWAALGQIDGAALVPVIVGVYWVALTCAWRVAVAAGLAGAAAIFVTEGLLGPFGWFGGPNATMWPELLAAGAVGGYVAARRQWLAAEDDRKARAEQAREEETRRRVDAERMRIARELHDVVAHSMAMINVQATAASMQLATDPASAAEAIQAIRSASKSGLRELRAILEVLRQVDGGSPAVPVPDLRAIAALVEATSAAGTPTTLEPAELPVPLPPPVALAVYRIVQESLTNVVRHAGRVAATVGLRQEGGYLYVDVVNDGGAATAAFSDGTGAGLAGMRERAAALGGTLDAGPRPGGGFTVHARLPVSATSPASGPQAPPAGPAGTGGTPAAPAGTGGTPAAPDGGAAGHEPAAVGQDTGGAADAGGPRGWPIASRP